MNFNPEELFKNVQGLQSKMTEMQAKFAQIRASGFAGGDMVCIEMNGNMQVVSIKISPEAIDPENSKLTEDLVLAAFNDAIANVKERINSEITSITGGLGIPPGFPGFSS